MEDEDRVPDLKPLFMREDIFAILKEKALLYFPSDRKVVLTFEEFETKKIDYYIKKKTKKVPDYCMVFDIKFIHINQHNLVGHLFYYENTLPLRIAMNIKALIIDIFNCNLSVHATVSSGTTRMMAILAQLKMDNPQELDKPLRYKIEQLGYILHIFDPCWLLRSMQSIFLKKYITFEQNSKKYSVSFQNFMHVISMSVSDEDMLHILSLENCESKTDTLKLLHSTCYKVISQNKRVGSGTFLFIRFFNALFDRLNTDTKLHHTKQKVWKNFIPCLKTMEILHSEDVKVVDKKQNICTRLKGIYQYIDQFKSKAKKKYPKLLKYGAFENMMKSKSGIYLFDAGGDFLEVTQSLYTNNAMYFQKVFNHFQLPKPEMSNCLLCEKCAKEEFNIKVLPEELKNNIIKVKKFKFKPLYLFSKRKLLVSSEKFEDSNNKKNGTEIEKCVFCMLDLFDYQKIQMLIGDALKILSTEILVVLQTKMRFITRNDNISITQRITDIIGAMDRSVVEINEELILFDFLSLCVYRVFKLIDEHPFSTYQPETLKKIGNYLSKTSPDGCLVKKTSVVCGNNVWNFSITDMWIKSCLGTSELFDKLYNKSKEDRKMFLNILNCDTIHDIIYKRFSDVSPEIKKIVKEKYTKPFTQHGDIVGLTESGSILIT